MIQGTEVEQRDAYPSWQRNSTNSACSWPSESSRAMLGYLFELQGDRLSKLSSVTDRCTLAVISFPQTVGSYKHLVCQLCMSCLVAPCAVR